MKPKVIDCPHCGEKHIVIGICPICGELVRLTTSTTTEGYLIASCFDSFPAEKWDQE
jgi:predicted RNA-binding Zn-ribbon protein involved in translation (DUF1610 family)